MGNNVSSSEGWVRHKSLLLGGEQQMETSAKPHRVGSEKRNLSTEGLVPNYLICEAKAY